MIIHKRFRFWRVEGNLSWRGDAVDDSEDHLRDAGEETLEEELLKADPDKWEIVGYEAAAESERAIKSGECDV